MYLHKLLAGLILLVYFLPFFQAENITGVRAIDGDTVHAGSEKIRIIGINTPERGERCYRESKEELERLLRGKTQIQRDIVNRDRYGRLLRHLFVNGSLVSEKMIESGNAKALCIFPDMRYCELLVKREADAVNEHRGCLFKKGRDCIRIKSVNEQGDWINIVNSCNESVNVTVQNSGRDSVKVTLKKGETGTVFIPIYEMDAVYIFSGGGLSDYRRCCS